MNTKNTNRNNWIIIPILILSIVSVSTAIADSNENIGVNLTIVASTEEPGPGPTGGGGGPTAAPAVEEGVEEGEVLAPEEGARPFLTGPLFDIILTIPEDYLEILPGKKLLFSVKLINLGLPGRADVTLEYWVKDSQDRVVYQSSETVAVETSASFTHEIDMPSGLEHGDYTLHAKVLYGDNQTATTYAPFRIVVRKKLIPIRFWYLIFLLFVVCMLGIVIWEYRKEIKEKMEERRIRKKVHEVIKRRGKIKTV